MRGITNSNITRSYLESKISQELMFSRYLDIDVDIIIDCANNNTLINSPLRDDPNASFGFAYNNKGKLKARDFGGVFWGDIYDLVAYLLSYSKNRIINISNKQDFVFVLQHIASTFSYITYSNAIDSTLDDDITDCIKKIKNQKSIIELVTRPFNKQDKNIWNKWGVSLSCLGCNFVYAVDQYYINRFANPLPKYYYKTNDPCYAYLLGITKNGIYNIKLYFPLRDKHLNLKFITNCTVLEGLPNLELSDYDFIILTKSSKDRLSIGNHIYNYPIIKDGYEFKIGVVNVPSENYKLSDREYCYLKSKLNDKIYSTIISFMDFDFTGRNCAKYLYDMYKIPYIFITNGQFGLENYNAKDFAELKESYSDDTINEFINYLFKSFYYE